MAATDPAIALAHWRSVRERLYREHPQSPVPAGERGAFRARHFDHDPRSASSSAWSPRRRRPGRAPARSCRTAAPTRSRSADSGPSACRSPTASARLSVFWMAGYAGGLFIPFRDAHERRRDLRRRPVPRGRRQERRSRCDPDTGDLILDFNFAVQPSCAFDPRWACPLAPPENRLDLPIRAGERLA